MSDLRYAFRAILQNPGFSAIAILTLALGIGANTAIFGIFDTVLIRPLAYRDPARLVTVQEIIPKFSPVIPVAASHYVYWRDHARSIQQIGLIAGAAFNLTSDGEPERLPGARLTASMFSMLGIRPLLGRTFLATEDQPGRDRVALTGEALWNRRFQGDRGIIGRKILLDGDPYQIVGVLANQPAMPQIGELLTIPLSNTGAEIWTPLALRSNQLPPFGNFQFGSIARLKPGVTEAQALADFDRMAEEITRPLPIKVELRSVLTPLQEQMTGSSRGSLIMLLAAVGAVLLIACVNIAGLMLIRATGRRRELAIRTAIGASAGRLFRQMLLDSLAFSAAGGLAGVALAYWILPLVVVNAPVSLPRLAEIHIDARVLAFASLLSIVTGFLAGILPAWKFAHADPEHLNAALKDGGRTQSEGRRAGRLRSLLVGVEVALSTVTLITGGLLLNSFVHLLRVDKGFDADRALTLNLNLPRARYPDHARRSEFIRNVLDGIDSLPAVVASGVTTWLPLGGVGGNNLIFVEGAQVPLTQTPVADDRGVSPGFFHAMAMQVVAGRVFANSDRSRPVALVSAQTAHRLWPNNPSPLGKRLRIGKDDQPWIEVIGVVSDLRAVSLQQAPNLTVYVPYWQRDRSDMSLVVRTAADPLAIAAAVRAEIRRLDPQLPVAALRSMRKVVDDSVAPRRFQLDLVLLFGAAALLLASLGVYGVVSYSVSQRTNEMGIRMVLGAARSDVELLVLRQGLAPVAGGLLAGIAAARLVAGLLASFLFGVPPWDPLTFASVTLIVLAATALGCYLPALRATRVDPMVSLRCT